MKKQIIVLLLCIMMLFSFACTKAPLPNVATAVSWDERLDALLEKATKEGFVLLRSESIIGNEDGFDYYYLTFPGDESQGKEVYLIQPMITNGVCEDIMVSLKLDDSRPINFDHIEFLMQALVQVCDPTIVSNTKAAQKRVQEIVESTHEGNDYIENGIFYFGGINMVDIYLVAHDAADWYANFDSDARINKTPNKELPFTADDWIGWYQNALNSSPVKIQKINYDPEIEPVQAYINPDHTILYSIKHQIGITVGWILFNSTDSGLYQISLIINPIYKSHGLEEDLREALLRACDSRFRTLPTGKSSEEIDNLIHRVIWYYESTEENGINYDVSYEDNSIIVSASE